MIKLLGRILVITVVLEGASLVFAEEMLLTTLILVTIALITASLVIRPDSARIPRFASRPSDVTVQPVVTSQSSLETSR